PSLVVAVSLKTSIVTLAMRPAFTSSRNCEYSIGACADWRVLNWLNTVISTSPMTSQMTRFLSMLFKDLAPYRQEGILLREQAPRHHVCLAGFTPGSRGLYDFWFHKHRLQALHERFEGSAVKCFDNENTVGLQHL